MTNPPRQYHEGYWYHVYARCLDRYCLFESDDERRWFLNKLDEVFSRRKLTLGALCLMDTHYHALVKMGPVSLDSALNGLHSSYVDYLNDHRPREGPLFRGRPGADIILDDSYLLNVVPYIHNNPVEAGIVSRPQDYRWHTDEMYRTGSWNEFSFEVWEFPPKFNGSDRSRRYRERMNEPVDDLPNEDGYIGDEEEWKALEKREEERKDRHRNRRDRPSMDTIAEKTVRDYDLTVEDLVKQGRTQPEARLRQKAMVTMYEEGYGPTEIGDFFNRNKGTVVYAVHKNQEEDNN